MKKLFIAFLCALGVLSLASCGESNTNKGPQTKRTVVQYCGWDLGTEEEPTLKRLMIEKFNATSETIRIEMVAPQGDYNEFLNTLAAGGALPDVFLVNSVPSAVISEQAMNITSLATADSEWENVESSLRQSVTYNDKIYAIPSAQNYMGLFVNYDLIDDYVDLEDDAEVVFAPGEFTTQQFLDVIPNVKDINNINDGTGVIGINATGDMINWLPATLDKTGTIQHYVWNGSSFDFTGEVMQSALRMIQSIGDVDLKYTFNSLADPSAPEDPRIALFGTTDENTVFINGQMAFLQAATYYWSKAFEEIDDFEWKFVGYPDGKVVSAADFMCLSRACKNTDAAFEVAKYLTYGADGINARYDVLDEYGDLVTLTGLPINTDAELAEKWFRHIDLPGAKEVFEKISEGKMTVLVEGNKTVPGFQNARFHFDTGIVIEGVRDNASLTIGNFIWDVCEGKITMNEYIANMTEARASQINDEIIKAMEAINKLD